MEPDPDTAKVKLDYLNAVRVSAFFVTLVATVVGRFPPRELVILCVSILAGGFLWKIPPFEIGPRPGIRNGFVSATIARGKAACLTTSSWGGIGGMFGAFAGAAIAGLTRSHTIPDLAGVGATWGSLICGLLGAGVWTMTRTVEDAKYLKRRQDSGQE